MHGWMIKKEVEATVQVMRSEDFDHCLLTGK